MQFKVINLDLIIKVKTEKTPLVANFMGRKHELGTGEHSFVFPLCRIDQILEIDFSGFTPQEKSQIIELELFYNKKKLDTKKITSFLMKNNLYVENKLMDVYDKVHFNGKLYFTFIRTCVFFSIWPFKVFILITFCY